MKKTILQLLFLFCLSLPLTFGQTTDGGSFWNKLGIGAGYNFLNNSGFPDDREKPFDVGSAVGAMPPYGGRFPTACLRTVRTRLHVYGSPPITAF